MNKWLMDRNQRNLTLCTKGQTILHDADRMYDSEQGSAFLSARMSLNPLIKFGFICMNNTSSGVHFISH